MSIGIKINLQAKIGLLNLKLNIGVHNQVVRFNLNEIQIRSTTSTPPLTNTR